MNLKEQPSRIIQFVKAGITKQEEDPKSMSLRNGQMKAQATTFLYLEILRQIQAFIAFAWFHRHILKLQWNVLLHNNKQNVFALSGALQYL